MAVNGKAWAHGSATHAARVLRNLVSATFGQPMISHANSATATTRGGSYGVVCADDLLVTTTGTLGYSVAAGRLVGPGTFATGQGAYVGYNDAAVTGNVGARDASNPRIDYIAYKVRDTDEDATGAEDDSIVVIAGTPAGSPSAPSIPSSVGTLVILSEVLVPSTANGGALQFTDRRMFASALGGIQPVRSSQRPSGAAKLLGKFFFEVDTFVTRVWDGTGFRRIVPLSTLSGTTQVGDIQIECASQTGTTDSAGDILINFTTTFAATPIVMVHNGEATQAFVASIGATRNTVGFSVRYRDYAGTVVQSTLVRCDWVAIGYATAVTS